MGQFVLLCLWAECGRGCRPCSRSGGGHGGGNLGLESIHPFLVENSIQRPLGFGRGITTSISYQRSSIGLISTSEENFMQDFNLRPPWCTSILCMRGALAFRRLDFHERESEQIRKGGRKAISSQWSSYSQLHFFCLYYIHISLHAQFSLHPSRLHTMLWC